MRTEFGSRRMHGVRSVGRGLLGVSDRLRPKSTTARLSLEPPASNRLAGPRAHVSPFVFSFPQNSQLEKVTSRFLSAVESGLRKGTQSVCILAGSEASDCRGRPGQRKLTADLPSSRIQRNQKSGLKVHAACRFASAKRDPDRALKPILIGIHSGRDGVTRPCNT
jgi:hypothetical protein